MRVHWGLIAVVTWAAIACGALLRELTRNEMAETAPRAPHARVDEAAVAKPSSAALSHRVREYDPFARPDNNPASAELATQIQPFPIAPSTPVNSRLQLAAIAGPPWRAIVVSEAPNVVFIALGVGDTIRGSRVIRISADSIVLRRSGSTSRQAVGESWTP